MNVYLVIYRDETSKIVEQRVSAPFLVSALSYIMDNSLELIGIVKL